MCSGRIPLLGYAGINKEEPPGRRRQYRHRCPLRVDPGMRRRLKRKNNPTEKNAWLAAGNTLAELLQAAQYDLLSSYGRAWRRSALIEQQIRQAWFGSAPGGTVWEVVGDVPQDSGASVMQPALTPAQAKALDQQLAALNQSQRSHDQAMSELRIDPRQTLLSPHGGKLEEPMSLQHRSRNPQTTFPDWSTKLKPYLEQTLYPELTKEVWEKYCAVQQAQSQLPNPTDANES